jgi:hypothetical protein
MGKGYGDGPAGEELLADAGEETGGVPTGTAVYGSTDDDPARHFLGWAEDVNPDELFASGAAWGITLAPRER